ncbi:MAG TPA: DUF6220 domain-containing protein [Jatrophihabitantaceae bacterium]|nr:DUF6220 domain-containing protein [Jatrophihabitantaceae bacterium]
MTRGDTELGRRLTAFTVYRSALLTFLIVGGAQIFLAGLGVFDVVGHQADSDSAFDAHRTLGFAMAGGALVILVLALTARAGIRAIVLSGVLFVLTALMQSLLAGLADDTALFGGLHALDGILILGITGLLYSSARRSRR